METAGLTVNEVQCGLHCLWLIKVKLWLQRSTVKEVQSRSDVLGRTLPGHSLDQMWWFGASVVSKLVTPKGGVIRVVYSECVMRARLG